MRCPSIVGRRPERETLRSALGTARIRRGRAVALLGPPGIGKSRLARDAADTARTWGMTVLVGRAVPAAADSPLRPLTEALLAGLRHRPEPGDAAALAPFRPALGRVLPQWRTASSGDEPPVVLGEGVLQLLAALAGEQGLLLVLEDLHWADPETLAVLEHLADNVADERLVVLATARDDPGPPRDVLHALHARHAVTLLPLAPLPATDVDAMATACLGAEPPPELRAVLHRRAAGTPLLVEELLAAGTHAASAVPATVAALVADRLAALPPESRRALEAAAVLGERFDGELLAATLGEPLPAVLAALRHATSAGVLDTGEGFRFHHALGRDAVLAAMLPPERREWAGRGLAALVARHPDLDGDRSDLATDLALGAGDTAAAAALLLAAGRRNLAAGGLVSAEAVLRRARDLPGADVPAVETVLADVLAQAGRTADAVEVGERCVERLRGAGGAALATALLRLARVHATAGEWAAAEELLAEARAHGRGDLLLRVDAAAAHVALGAGRIADAAARARAVVARDGPADAVCDALLVLGRVARRTDLTEAAGLAARAREVAEAAGLPVAAARARHELVISDVQTSLRLDRLAQAREGALALGDLAAVAVLDLQTTAIHNARWEPEAALAAAERCVAASRRLRLPTLPKGLVLGAVARTYLGQDDAAEAAMAEALALAPEDAHLLGEIWGVRAMVPLRRADDGRALEHLERAQAAFTLRPHEVTGSPVVGLWELLRAATGADRPRADPHTVRWNVGLGGLADAIALGRAGDDRAAGTFLAADAMLRRPVDITWHRLQGRRVAAAAALADGWGDPASWLAEDLPLLEARGEDRWAAAARGLWRRTGAAVPRGRTGVPPALRALGVTAREAEVLALVAEGRDDGEIARRLHLSPRTVEKHVERLRTKSGTARRAQLVAWGVRVLGAT